MPSRIRGNEYRTTIVCVDSYEHGVLAGHFYYSLLPGGESFQSLTEFLVKMDRALDSMNLPQSFTATRSFAQLPRPEALSFAEQPAQAGALATFAVRVIFRQNASWQGSVTWLEPDREESFRSVLELILLLDSALSATE